MTIDRTIVEFLTDQAEFSKRTYGSDEHTKGVLEHIRKELEEIESDPDDVVEWIDVAILAFDGARRRGYSPRQIADALETKLSVNKARKWPDWRTAGDGPIEHVKE